MSDAAPGPLSETPPFLHDKPAQIGRWRLALAISFVMLAALGLLLARLIWLPMYFGLFFFLVAGLLVSAAVFRIARPARPISGAIVFRGTLLVSILAIAAMVFWEYRYFAGTVGELPHFPDARNAAVAAGRSAKDVQSRAGEMFSASLREHYPPGGMLGYARWSIRPGQMNLTIDGETDSISSPHRGIIWPLRTLGALALLAVGLWLGLESLRSATTTTNVLAPGEEAAEEE